MRGIVVTLSALVFFFTFGDFIDQFLGHSFNGRLPASEYGPSTSFEAILQRNSENTVQHQIAKRLEMEKVEDLKKQRPHYASSDNKLLSTKGLLEEVYLNPISEGEWKKLEPKLAPENLPPEKQDEVNRDLLKIPASAD